MHMHKLGATLIIINAMPNGSALTESLAPSTEPHVETRVARGPVICPVICCPLACPGESCCCFTCEEDPLWACVLCPCTVGTTVECYVCGIASDEASMSTFCDFAPYFACMPCCAWRCARNESPLPDVGYSERSIEHWASIFRTFGEPEPQVPKDIFCWPCCCCSHPCIRAPRPDQRPGGACYNAIPVRGHPESRLRDIAPPRKPPFWEEYGLGCCISDPNAPSPPPGDQQRASGIPRVDSLGDVRAGPNDTGAPANQQVVRSSF